jgi:carboxypeptidase Q
VSKKLVAAACLSLAAVVACARPEHAAAPVAAPDEVTPELDAIRRLALSSPQAFDVVRSLTEEVGPRSAGSPGDKQAVAWARRAMSKVGLTDVRTEPVTVKRWVRGEESAAVVSPFAQKLSVAALGGSVGARGLEAEVVVFDDLEALTKADKGRVAGKIVFLDTPMHKSRDGSEYGRVVPNRSQGAVVAAKLGAVGVLVRSVGTDHNRLPHTGAMREAPIPAAALAVPDAQLLRGLFAYAGPVRVTMSLGAHTEGEAPSADVLGEVRGREFPNDIVLLGAHLDSWDLGTGAIDDGAGCAIVLEAARLIAAMPPPRRTVRVVLFANEEHGLDGAKAYAKAHAAEVDHHVAALEADTGGGPVYRIRALGGPNTPALLASIAAHAALGIALDGKAARGGADLSPLVELGVPVVDLSQDASDYFDFHHTANDTLDKIDPVSLEQAAVYFASVAYELATDAGEMGPIPPAQRKSE